LGLPLANVSIFFSSFAGPSEEGILYLLILILSGFLTVFICSCPVLSEFLSGRFGDKMRGGDCAMA
jgi:hypothetical protein